METDEKPYGAPRGLLLTLGIVGIILGGAIAGEFVLRLQPQLTGPVVTTQAGVAAVAMPANAASVNFNPVNLVVVIGVNNTVQWTNQDTVQHTVVTSAVPSGATQFHSGIMSKGDTFMVTLNITGVYDYYCSIHPATMKGSITVKLGTGGGSGVTVVIPSGTAAQGLNYIPANFRVVIGVNNTVTFANRDSTTHTVTANDGSFDSRDIPAGQSWTFTFATAGTFSFHCIYHPSMKGTVTVVSG